jgi:hypothetical protein
MMSFSTIGCHVERVARAGIVPVVAPVVVREAVVVEVVQPLEAERRAHLVPFGGMVVDHVQDHLEPRGMKTPHHLLELRRVARGGVSSLRGEKPDRVVSPVVFKTLLQEVPAVHEGVHRHELYGSDPQLFEIF